MKTSITSFISKVQKNQLLILIIIIGVAFPITIWVLVHKTQPEPKRYQAGKVAGSGQEPYYISPNGTENSFCNLAQPCDGLQTVLSLPDIGEDPGDIVIVKDGTYMGAQKIINRNFAHEVSVVAEHPYQAILENSGVVLQIFNVRNLKLSGFEIRHKQPIPTCDTSNESSYLVHIKDVSDPGGFFGAKKGPDNVYYDNESRLYPNGTDYTGNITLQNNILHDSYCEDIIKIQNGGDINIVGNMFYNQATRNNTNGISNTTSTPEEAIDVNSVFNVRISGNIFFNNYASASETGAFIVVKDSSLGVPHGESRFGLLDQTGNVVVPYANGNVITDNSPNITPVSRNHTCDPSGSNCDTVIGSNNVVIEKNIFMSYRNSIDNQYPFLQLGAEDTKFFAVNQAVIENNLFLGNSDDVSRSVLEVEGTNYLTFRNNTIHGNLPARHYGFRLKTQDQSWKYPNDHISFYNNIWSDPSGTMGSEAGAASFSRAETDSVSANRTLNNNLYWNGLNVIPDSSSYLYQIQEDTSSIVQDPQLPLIDDLNNPVWNGDAFGALTNFGTTYSTIQGVFTDLVTVYAIPLSSDSVLINSASLAQSPSEDILGRVRTSLPDVGAVEIFCEDLPDGCAPIPSVTPTNSPVPTPTQVSATPTLSPTMIPTVMPNNAAATFKQSVLKKNLLTLSSLREYLNLATAVQDSIAEQPSVSEPVLVTGTPTITIAVTNITTPTPKASGINANISKTPTVDSKVTDNTKIVIFVISAGISVAALIVLLMSLTERNKK